MASSSGNSSASNNKKNNLQNSGSEEDLQALMDQRKRKRMQSNRESARRSRLRKQQRLDELVSEAARLRRENSQIAAGVGVTARHLDSVEAENSVLTAQMSELTQRLDSLNDVVSFVENSSAGLVMNSVVRFSHPIAAIAATDTFLC